MRHLLVVALLCAGPAGAGVLDWVPQAGDDPCLIAPAGAEDVEVWRAWRAGLDCPPWDAALPTLEEMRLRFGDDELRRWVFGGPDPDRPLPGTVPPIPLPGGAWLLLSALAGLLVCGRR